MPNSEAIVYQERDLIKFDGTVNDFSIWDTSDATFSDSYWLINKGGYVSTKISNDSENKIINTFKQIKVYTKVSKDSVSISNYKSDASVFISVKYSVNGAGDSVDIFQIGFNDLTSTESDFIEDNTLLELKGNTIEEIKIKIKAGSNNISVYGLSIVGAYKQYDLDTIVDVSHFESIQADVAEINTSFTSNLLAERIATNFSAVDVNKVYSGDRDYIEIVDNIMRFVTSTVSASDTENYVVDGVQYYWTTVVGDDAYRFMTTTDPVLRERYGSLMSEDEKEGLREKFRVKIRKQSDTITKKISTFASIDGYEDIPVDIYGAGDGVPSVHSDVININIDGYVLCRDTALLYKIPEKVKFIYIDKDDNIVDLLSGSGGVNLSPVKNLSLYSDKFTIETHDGGFSTYNLVSQTDTSITWNNVEEGYDFTINILY